MHRFSPQYTIVSREWAKDHDGLFTGGFPFIFFVVSMAVKLEGDFAATSIFDAAEVSTIEELVARASKPPPG